MAGAAAGAVRIGVVADTHVGDVLPTLPDEVLDALAGVDLIVHAGDVVWRDTLDRLAELAPVVAVQGNHDQKAGLELPRAALVRAGGRLIGVVHGHSGRARELPAALVSLLTGRVVTLGLEQRLTRSLDHPDCVVFGHLHVPAQVWVGRTLVFSPGPVYVGARDTEYQPIGMAQRVSSWLGRRVPALTVEPAIGILEVAGGQLEARRVTLTRPIRPLTPEARGRRPRLARPRAVGERPQDDRRAAAADTIPDP